LQYKLYKLWDLQAFASYNLQTWCLTVLYKIGVYKPLLAASLQTLACNWHGEYELNMANSLQTLACNQHGECELNIANSLQTLACN
jgi:hypothetical protein